MNMTNMKTMVEVKRKNSCGFASVEKADYKYIKVRKDKQILRFIIYTGAFWWSHWIIYSK